MTQHDCGYRNTTDRMVIVRCLGPDSFYLERVVFPFELLSFQCPPGSDVEIWTHGLGGPELLESLPSQALRLEAQASIAEIAEHRLDVPWLKAV
jgi:hypothetical protein